MDEKPRRCGQSMDTISIRQLTEQLLDLGVHPGGTLLVHCAFSKVRPVEDGPLGLIAALEYALGANGTLVMPSMTDDDNHPFDPTTTPCRRMGIVADIFCGSPAFSAATVPTRLRRLGRKPPSSPRRIRQLSPTAWTARSAACTISTGRYCCSA